MAESRDLTMPCTRNSVWFSRWESPSKLLECMSAPEIRNDNLNLQAVLGNANVYHETMSYHERVSGAPTKYDRREGTAELDDIEARIEKLRKELDAFLEISEDALTLESRNATLLLTNDIGVLERRQRQIFMEIGQEVSLQFEYPVQQITNELSGLVNSVSGGNQRVDELRCQDGQDVDYPHDEQRFVARRSACH